MNHALTRTEPGHFRYSEDLAILKLQLGNPCCASAALGFVAQIFMPTKVRNLTSNTPAYWGMS